MYYPGDKKIILDGQFTPKELRDLAGAIENFNKENK
jgi:hypothetical protein